GRPQELAEFYAHYGDTQAALGNTKLAAEYQRKSREVNDSLLTVRHQARIDHLMAEYETERIKRRLVQSEVSRLTAERSAARYRLIGLLLLLACLLGGAIWWYLNNRRRRRQLEYKKQQAELRYALLRAQMNPHFIFNSLNSIQSFFSNQRFNTGNDYLSIFSQLVRRILEQTAQTAIPLSEELETLELYLSLEKLRLGKLLSYDIHLIGDVAPDITYVPPLVFQPFVENAIWHGIAPRNAPGKIDIFIRYEEEQHYLHGRIEDDGIGLQAPPKIESHRSQGVRITRERLGPGGNVNISNRFGPDRQVEGVRTELIIPLHN
ncbi:MAG: histidine kinase, partial [Bacteroidota bacterium]